MDSGLLAEKLIEEAALRNVTIALAESCTGGMIAGVLTDIPGASKVFLGSAVTYSNEAKIDILGVDPDIINDHGAVSSHCAEKMAEGAKRIFRSEIALSVTGIAGPDGGSAEKPVGTVWFGISSNDATYTFKKQFSGERALIRNSAVKTALEALLERVQ
ncbi:MAG: CinA family protein [Synergistaceae bacterium]|jgi:PncC family amidohydrolase|nr:CinA family protein [Synergistaceae bacterium]